MEPSSPTAPRKQVGFAGARLSLVIPPPEASWTPEHHPDRKQSIFIDQLHGIKDFTKSGVGFGERCAYCVYKKVRAWSRRWFTHMFLTIVLLLYTIGGALVFEVIEGQAESAVETDLAKARDDLLKELRVTSIRTPIEKSLEEWIGEASRHIQIRYEARIENYYSSHKLAVMNGFGKRIWTFWNSIVYCGTIYTSIGKKSLFISGRRVAKCVFSKNTSDGV